MRAPLIVLIVIYAVSVLGLVLIPGVDAQGNPWRMDFFHAFYFMSYTATTIGFGEIPYAFTDAQRLWVTFSIYLSVVGWAYGIGALITLTQDKGFRQALATQRFRRQVRRLTDPFYLICGCGESGMLLCRALDQLGIRLAVLDHDELQINELALQDLQADAPALAVDARLPDHLALAGLGHRRCQGVIALTSDDSVNLAIAIAVRLLRPSLPVLCRIQSADIRGTLVALGVDHIINPFAKFGEYLALAMTSPGSYQLFEWLTGLPGTTLRAETEPPRGPWIVCGYGRFGREVVKQLAQAGLPAAVITSARDAQPDQTVIVGRGSDREMLRQAGVDRAVGLVAGTDEDANNLAIAMTARQLNPKLFVVLRQNLHANQVLFNALQADLNMVASEIIAHECLALLTTPLLSRFLAIVKQREDAWADAVVARLQRLLGTEVPALWSINLDAAEAPAIHQALAGGDQAFPLDGLLRDSSDRTSYLACLPLLLVRAGQDIELPPADAALLPDDQLLFAGTPEARNLQALTLQNVNVRDYVRYGADTLGGWVWLWLAGRRHGVRS